MISHVIFCLRDIFSISFDYFFKFVKRAISDFLSGKKLDFVDFQIIRKESGMSTSRIKACIFNRRFHYFFRSITFLSSQLLSNHLLLFEVPSSTTNADATNFSCLFIFVITSDSLWYAIPILIILIKSICPPLKLVFMFRNLKNTNSCRICRYHPKPSA